jgi:hypothetical protein
MAQQEITNYFVTNIAQTMLCLNMKDRRGNGRNVTLLADTKNFRLTKEEYDHPRVAKLRNKGKLRGRIQKQTVNVS